MLSDRKQWPMPNHADCEISRFLFQNEKYKGMRCPSRYPFQKPRSKFQLDGLLSLTRTAIGLGVGMLLADQNPPPHSPGHSRRARFGRRARRGSVAGEMATERINRPESERGSRNRLRSIRGDSGYRSETTFIRIASVTRSPCPIATCMM